MAKKKDERFLKVHEEGNGFGWMRTVWVDKQTGVNYLFVNSGYAGGMSVLLGADGKPSSPRFPTATLTIKRWRPGQRPGRVFSRRSLTEDWQT